jgi:hypothetical protein
MHPLLFSRYYPHTSLRDKFLLLPIYKMLSKARIIRHFLAS